MGGEMTDDLPHFEQANRAGKFQGFAHESGLGKFEKGLLSPHDVFFDLPDPIVGPTWANIGK